MSAAVWGFVGVVVGAISGAVPVAVATRLAPQLRSGPAAPSKK